MSRRFGRNQRRRARERIAVLESVYRDQETHLARIDRDLLEARRAIRQAMEIAGGYCLAFPPEIMRHYGPPKPYLRLFGGAQSLPTWPYKPPGSSILEWEHVPNYLLPVMFTHVAEDLRTSAVHVKVEYNGGAWGYASPPIALLRMGKARFIKSVSEILAGQIYAGLTSGV